MSVRVLIADDSAEYREILAGMAQSLGWEVRLCADGAAALAAARAAPPRLAILDVGLPDMDGRELCRRLKAAAGGGLPVVLISGSYRPDQDRIRGAAGGADAFLAKPFRLSELSAKAKSLLEEYGGEDTAR